MRTSRNGSPFSKPGIHHHFPTKAQLVLKVVRRYRHNIQVATEAGMRAVSDPVRQLSGHVGHWAACIEDRSMPFCVCAMPASERRTLPVEVNAEITAHFKTLSAWLEGILAKGDASGQFTLRQSVELEAQCFMSLIHGAMLTARAGGQRAVRGDQPGLDRALDGEGGVNAVGANARRQRFWLAAKSSRTCQAISCSSRLFST